ncbi:MAG: septal ring lytic transglycosylase RlpA family protein [Bacteroidaceae bacterium]|nr:septal ring lytic transglycosylase RlpA family protein [Bacteroidaceae bacterium]
MNRIIAAIIVIAGSFVTGFALAQRYDGLASYYGSQFHGRRTADGSTYNMHEYTCAHKSLPFGTKVRVTNLNNQKSIVVTVTDRGPYRRGRVVDLSIAAARDLDMLHKGVAPVSVEVISDNDEKSVNELSAKSQEWQPTKKTMEFKLDIKKLNKEFTFPNLLHDHQVS